VWLCTWYVQKRNSGHCTRAMVRQKVGPVIRTQTMAQPQNQIPSAFSSASTTVARTLHIFKFRGICSSTPFLVPPGVSLPSTMDRMDSARRWVCRQRCRSVLNLKGNIQESSLTAQLTFQLKPWQAVLAFLPAHEVACSTWHFFYCLKVVDQTPHGAVKNTNCCPFS
jgi:hypothetical protein